MLGSISSFFDFDDKAIFTALKGNAMVKRFVAIERGDVRTNLMSGEFAFRNLDLNKEGFEQLAPVKMKQGYIERVDVKMPFGKLDKEPMLCELSGLYILFGPVEANTWKKTKVKAALKKNTILMGIVRKVIKQVKEEIAAAGYPILNLARFSLENIHIRFESLNGDGSTNAEGLVLMAASMEPTTPEHAALCSDQKARAAGKEPSMHLREIEPDLRNGADVTKAVEYKGLAFYCDLKTPAIQPGDGLVFMGQMKRIMSASHSYIMEPQGAASDTTMGLTMIDGKVKVNDYHFAWKFMPIIGVVHKPMVKKIIEVLGMVSKGRYREAAGKAQSSSEQRPSSSPESSSQTKKEVEIQAIQAEGGPSMFAGTPLGTLKSIGSFTGSSSMMLTGMISGLAHGVAGADDAEDQPNNTSRLQQRVKELEAELAERAAVQAQQQQRIMELEVGLAEQTQQQLDREQQILDELAQQKDEQPCVGCVPNKFWSSAGSGSAAQQGTTGASDTCTNDAGTEAVSDKSNDGSNPIHGTSLGKCPDDRPGDACSTRGEATLDVELQLARPHEGNGRGGGQPVEVGGGPLEEEGAVGSVTAGVGAVTGMISAGVGTGIHMGMGVGMGVGVLGAGVGAAVGEGGKNISALAVGVEGQVKCTDADDHDRQSSIGSPQKIMTVAQAKKRRGALFKRGMGKGKLRVRNWQQRWFTIEDSGRALLYFADNRSTAVKGRFDLSGYSVRRMGGKEAHEAGTTSTRSSSPPSPSKYDRCFELSHPDPDQRQLQLRAESEGELRQWVAAISCLIDGIIDDKTSANCSEAEQENEITAAAAAAAAVGGKTLKDVVAARRKSFDAAGGGAASKSKAALESTRAAIGGASAGAGVVGFIDSLN
jgi:hypothetical protein